MKILLTLIAGILILLLAIVIGAQNDQVLVLNYLIAQTPIQLSTLMAIMLLIGVLLSLSALSFYCFRLKWRISRLERLVKKNTQLDKP